MAACEACWAIYRERQAHGWRDTTDKGRADWWASYANRVHKEVLAQRQRVATLVADKERLTRIIEIERHAHERLALCPDHRDKASGICIVCQAERRTRQELSEERKDWNEQAARFGDVLQQERARADAAERERDDLKAAVVSWVAAKRAYDAGANATLSEAFQQSRELGNCDEVLCRFAEAARASAIPEQEK